MIAATVAGRPRREPRGDRRGEQRAAVWADKLRALATVR